MALNKRIRRVFLENKVQYIGSILLILLSTYTFTMMNQFAANFGRLVDDFQTDYVQEDAAFTTETPISTIDTLQAASDALIQEQLSVDYNIGDSKTLRLFSDNDKVNIPAITAGTDLSQNGEILLGQYFASANNYAIGDSIQLLDRTFTVVGFMTRPNYMYPVQSDSDLLPNPNFGSAVISRDDMLAFEQVTSTYAVKYNEAGEDLVARAIAFREVLANNGVHVLQWTDIENNKRVSIVRAEVQVLSIVSKLVPTAILLLATVMVANILWRMINNESRIIGALYALGYKRWEIYRHYMIFPLLIAIAGGIIGSIFGALMVRFMVSFFVSIFIIPLTDIELNPPIMLISPLIPILVLGLTGSLVIRSELKHSPVELMRGKEGENKVSALERGIKLDNLGFAMRFAIKQQLRSISRVAFLLIGVTVATVLLLWGIFLKTSTDFLIAGISDIYDFEYEYGFPELHDEPLPEGAEPFAADFFLPDATSDDFYVAGVLPNSAVLKLDDKSGNALSLDQVIVTAPLAERMGISAGDTASIIRRIDGRTFTLNVGAIADSYAGSFIFMPLDDFNTTFERPEGTYNGAFSNEAIQFPEDVDYFVVTLEEKVAGVQQIIAPTVSMIVIVMSVAFVIAVLVIYVVTTLIVDENKDIIALMKVFGYRRKEINRLILNSSTIVVVIGYLIGIPLTNAAVGTLTQTMEDSVGLALPPANISLPYLLLGFVVVILAYQLSKWLCRKKVNTVSMSEALKAAAE